MRLRCSKCSVEKAIAIVGGTTYCTIHQPLEVPQFKMMEPRVTSGSTEEIPEEELKSILGI